LVVLAIVPLLAATVAVRFVFPYRSVFHPRYLIYAAPLICVLVASAIQQKHKLSTMLGVIASLTLVALWLPAVRANYFDAAVARDDTRAAVHHVSEALERGDVIVMQRDNFAARYYFAPDVPVLAAPEGLHGILREADTIMSQINQLSAKRVRLFLWQDDVVDPQRLLEAMLWANGAQIGEYNFRQIRLPLFQVQSPLREIPFVETDAIFGDQLRLRTAWLKPSAMAGDLTYVVLRWQPLRGIDHDYKVFVHVVGADGTVAFQRDKMALNALVPMTQWSALGTEVVQDSYALLVPADLAAGEYRVRIGVYNPQTGERLAVQSTTLRVTDNAADLGTISITAK